MGRAGKDKVPVIVGAIIGAIFAVPITIKLMQLFDVEVKWTTVCVFMLVGAWLGSRGYGSIEAMFLWEEIHETPGPLIRFNCIACGLPHTEGLTHERRICDWIFMLFPVRLTHVTTILCLQCGESLGTGIRLDDLVYKTPEELVGRIYFRSTLFQKAFSIFALFFAVIPIVGLIMAVVAMLANWKTRAWPKRVSKIALGLSLVITACLLAIGGLVEIGVLE